MDASAKGLIHEYQRASCPGLRILRAAWLGGVTVRGWLRSVAAPPIEVRPS
jgi:hypothetical protein